MTEISLSDDCLEKHGIYMDVVKCSPHKDSLCLCVWVLYLSDDGGEWKAVSFDQLIFGGAELR